jgi:hypothetical protein
MRYVTTRYQSQQRDLIYRIYVTNCLRIITENTAKQAGGNYMTAEYTDLIHPKKKDDKTGNEIVADFIQSSGIKVV